MDYVKIAIMPALMLLGVALRQLGAGPKAPHLERFVVNFTFPLLMVTEVLAISVSAAFAGTIGLAAITFLTVSLALSFAQTTREKGPVRGAIILNSTFFNSMFLSFPILLAFHGGDFSVAILFVVPIMLIHNTFGVVISSHFGSGAAGKKALLGALKFPPLIGLAAGLLLKLFIPASAATAPEFSALNTIGLLTAYLVLVLVGLHLPIPKDPWNLLKNRAVWLIGVNRFVFAPIVGLVIIAVFGLEGIARSTVLIMSLMPPAITNMIISSRFKLDNGITSQSIFLLTLVSLAIIFSLEFLGLI